MIQEIYDPLNEYVKLFRDRFREVAENTFDQLTKEAQVDVESNHRTCRKYYDIQAQINSLGSRLGWWKVLRFIHWASILSIAAYTLYKLLIDQTEDKIMLLAIGAMHYSVLVPLLIAVYGKIRIINEEQGTLTVKAQELKDKAWEEMAPLNRLYDWDILPRMMAQTVPKLEFDSYFTTKRLADLQNTYGWDDSFNDKRSVIYSHSGRINGNPFVICRTRRIESEEKTYTGHLTIHWMETHRDANGNSYTVQRSQTLTASVTAPYPVFCEDTRLIYGNIAAPDLIFYRKKSGLAGNKGSRAYNKNKRRLKKLSRDLSNKDFAMMTNEEFEVAFDTSDRNDNQQYALLFTPLAQENMLKLLKDHSSGYGDDFNFEKNKMINTIVPDHLQELKLDMEPAQYENFDYNKAKDTFISLNANYFRAIYFTLAPLLCIPMYQQIRSHKDIYCNDIEEHSSFWEHESLANYLGEDYFKHPSCATNCILKTERQLIMESDASRIKVNAFGYEAVERLTYVSRFGGDGRFHDVPVYWYEYLPVTGTGYYQMMEDNEAANGKDITQTQRINHINDLLFSSKYDIYRKHIASKIN